MKIAILGYSRQGQSAYEYWNTPENELTICDQNPKVGVPDGARAQLGKNYLQALERFDLLVRTPSLHPRDIVAASPDNPAILDKVTSNTNEFFRVCPSRRIIGVTGTKGKGTASTLIARILEADGKRVHLGGNIGIPPLDMLKADIQGEDWVVLELANFQLIDLKYSPPIAVCLMVEPEHLNWHTDMAEYMEAKQQLFAHQRADDVSVYYAHNENSRHVASASPGTLLPYMREPGACVENNMVRVGGYDICATNELKLLGEHNWQNVCAALTACWQVTQNIAAMREAVVSFTGLPHRLEPVKTIHEVTYYNDSFASAPAATPAALASIPGSKVMIVGGFDRGIELEDYAASFAKHQDEIRHTLIIGQARERIAAAFRAHGFTQFEVCDTKDLTAIVRQAAAAARPGDAVILSPGFPSFDMFTDFEERGNRFRQAVEAL